MSTKVCLPAWNGGPRETKDAISINNLMVMCATLVALGNDGETPVTYLFDDDHVWLETVEFDEDEGPEPKTWKRLADVPIAVSVVDPDGDIWAHHSAHGWRWHHPGRHSWHEVTDINNFPGPFTEVMDD